MRDTHQTSGTLYLQQLQSQRNSLSRTAVSSFRVAERGNQISVWVSLGIKSYIDPVTGKVMRSGLHSSQVQQQYRNEIQTLLNEKFVVENEDGRRLDLSFDIKFYDFNRELIRQNSQMLDAIISGSVNQNGQWSEARTWWDNPLHGAHEYMHLLGNGDNDGLPNSIMRNTQDAGPYSERTVYPEHLQAVSDAVGRLNGGVWSILRK